MSELIAFVFDDEAGAKNLEQRLVAAQSDQQMQVGDAALVVRQEDGRPLLNHATGLVGRGSLGGIFWGVFFALVFWAKWWDLSIGGALGDLALEEEFVKDVGDSVEKGHSALLVFIEDRFVDDMLNLAGEYNPKIIRSAFTEDSEMALQRIFQAPRE